MAFSRTARSSSSLVRSTPAFWPASSAIHDSPHRFAAELGLGAAPRGQAGDCKARQRHTACPVVEPEDVQHDDPVIADHVRRNMRAHRRRITILYPVASPNWFIASYAACCERRPALASAAAVRLDICGTACLSLQYVPRPCGAVLPVRGSWGCRRARKQPPSTPSGGRTSGRAAVPSQVCDTASASTTAARRPADQTPMLGFGTNIPMSRPRLSICPVSRGGQGQRPQATDSGNYPVAALLSQLRLAAGLGLASVASQLCVSRLRSTMPLKCGKTIQNYQEIPRINSPCLRHSSTGTNANS